MKNVVRATALLLFVINFLACVVLNLFPPGLHGSYYANSAWENVPVFTAIDKHISTTLLNAFLQKKLVDDDFSVEWTGYLNVPETGLYWFSTTSDAESWLLIDDQLVVDNSGSHKSVQKVGSAQLKEGVHPVTIRYAQHDEDSTHLQIQWKIDGGMLLEFTAAVLTPSTLQLSTPRYSLYRSAKTLLPVCLKLWGGLLIGLFLFGLFKLLTTKTRQDSPKRINGRVLSAQLGIVGLIGVFNISLFLFAREIVPVSDGLGWDGWIYAGMVRMFSQHRFVGDFLNPYHIRRIVPSGIVALLMSVFRIPLTNAHIELTFQGYHSIIIGIGVYLWHSIAQELRLSRRGLWLGFWALFGNFALAKWAFYYPTLTDTTGYLLGLGLLWAFLKRNQLAVLLFLIVGFFTWPNFFELGFALLLFPRSTFVAEPTRVKVNMILAILAGGIVLTGSVYVIYIIQHQWFGTTPIRSVMPLSIGLTALFVFYGVKTLTDYQDVYNVRTVLQRLDVYWAGIGGLTFILLKLLIAIHMQQGISTIYSFRDFLANLLLLGNRQPFVFFITHVVFFGPLLILTFLFWKRVCQSIHEHGIGLSLMTLAGLALSIYPESRSLMNLAPLFLIMTVKAVDSLPWNPSYYTFLGYLSVFYSRIWLLISADPKPDGGLLTFSWQKLFMTSGYVVSGLAYLIQMGVVLLTGIVLYFLLDYRSFHLHDCKSEKAERM